MTGRTLVYRIHNSIIAVIIRKILKTIKVVRNEFHKERTGSSFLLNKDSGAS